MTTHALSRRTALLLGGAALLPGLAAPKAVAAVAEPLDRPALPTRLAARSALLGLARAGSRLVAVGERGIVVLSDDAGRSWRQAAAVPVSVTLTAVQFIDARTGYAVGHYGAVLRSEDGGEHWERLLDGDTAAQRVLQAAQAHGAGDDASARALKEAQRGVQDGPDKPWLALHFIDALRGIVVGAYNLALATEDGGKSWQPWLDRLPNPKASHLYAIARQADEIWLAGEQGLVLHSADAGASFRRLALPYSGSFFTATLVPDGGGAAIVVAGLRGNAWRSADQGESWQRIAVPMPVSLTAATLDAKGALYLADQAGQVMVSRDAGRTLAPFGESPTPQVGALLALDGGSLLVAGWRGVGLAAPSKKGLAS
ncbi:Uncharacterized protein VAR608DRAFT_1198 [Variovorax sp. HW608]|uniref:WD40/YVTN/BNR-like repeat-containing protein n=1 Tax=Variovorax sp. HW608 TaxID=1034889 RepID=UPI00081FC842|nr:YCF48-related protein [Variovorax sp. HW608]SCK17312.1 Uncharacterized protein VAR608DRAFT_1198 [Variovorax sp. HW608]